MRVRIAGMVVMTSIAACGGSTTTSSTSSGAVHGSSGGSSGAGADDRGCTEIGCADGLTVEFSYREQGSYEIGLMLDGVQVTCRATIPLPVDDASPCSRADVILTRSGSRLPVAQQSIGPLTIHSSPAKIGVAIARTKPDGSKDLLGAHEYTPRYETTPGPNGPGCEPLQCTSASVSYP